MNRILEVFAFLQPYMISAIFLLLVLLLGSGCATSDGDSAARTRAVATTVATTAVGGYIGAKEGDGKPESAALGAAAGFILGETINYFSDKAQREAYLAGYEKGQSNAIKQQYWIARENQRLTTDDGYDETLYEIPIPASVRDGVRREATTRVVRVVMPREDNTP